MKPITPPNRSGPQHFVPGSAVDLKTAFHFTLYPQACTPPVDQYAHHYVKIKEMGEGMSNLIPVSSLFVFCKNVLISLPDCVLCKQLSEQHTHTHTNKNNTHTHINWKRCVELQLLLPLLYLLNNIGRYTHVIHPCSHKSNQKAKKKYYCYINFLNKALILCLFWL